MFIAYTFPPVQKVSSRRLRYLYLYFRERFGAVHVITSSVGTAMPTDPELAVPAEPIVIQQKDLRYWLAGRRDGTLPDVLPHAQKSSCWYRSLRRLRGAFPFLLLFGDGSPAYLWRSYRQGKRLVDRGGITHLFSSYPPWSNHLVAWALKRRFPHLTWIADFRDLHVDPSRNDVWWPAMQRRVTRWLLRRADTVWTVSQGLRQTLERLHPRVRVVRNHLAHLPPPRTAPRSAVFTISYTGALYYQLSDPGLLFGTLRELLATGQIAAERIRLQYFGSDHLAWDRLVAAYDLTAISDSSPKVERALARCAQQEAQLNLLLSWSHPQQRGILTAKLYEYLAAGRPILTLLHGPPDPELTALVEATGAGRVFSDQLPTHADALRDWLLHLYTTWQHHHGCLPWSMDRAALRPLLTPVEEGEGDC